MLVTKGNEYDFFQNFKNISISSEFIRLPTGQVLHLGL